MGTHQYVVTASALCAAVLAAACQDSPPTGVASRSDVLTRVAGRGPSRMIACGDSGCSTGLAPVCPPNKLPSSALLHINLPDKSPDNSSQSVILLYTGTGASAASQRKQFVPIGGDCVGQYTYVFISPTNGYYFINPSPGGTPFLTTMNYPQQANADGTISIISCNVSSSNLTVKVYAPYPQTNAGQLLGTIIGPVQIYLQGDPNYPVCQ